MQRWRYETLGNRHVIENSSPLQPRVLHAVGTHVHLPPSHTPRLGLHLEGDNEPGLSNHPVLDHGLEKLRHPRIDELRDSQFAEPTWPLEPGIDLGSGLVTSPTFEGNARRLEPGLQPLPDVVVDDSVQAQVTANPRPTTLCRAKASASVCAGTCPFEIDRKPDGPMNQIVDLARTPREDALESSDDSANQVTVDAEFLKTSEGPHSAMETALSIGFIMGRIDEKPYSTLPFVARHAQLERPPVVVQRRVASRIRTGIQDAHPGHQVGDLDVGELLHRKKTKRLAFHTSPRQVGRICGSRRYEAGSGWTRVSPWWPAAPGLPVVPGLPGDP